MFRRKDSKMDKLRAEEDAIDAKLRDAGLYEEGMNLGEKRQMLQLIEESCQTAQQEEEERQQLRQKEHQALSESLNRSYQSDSQGHLEADGNQSDEGQNKEEVDKEGYLDCDSLTPSLYIGSGDRQTPSISSAGRQQTSQSCTPTLVQQKKHNSAPSHSQVGKSQTQSHFLQKGKTLSPVHSQQGSENSSPSVSKNNSPSEVQSQFGESFHTPAQDHIDLFASDIKQLKTSRRRLQLGEEVNTRDISQEDQPQQEDDNCQEIVMGSQEKTGNNLVGSGLKVNARRPLREQYSPELSSPNHQCSPSPKFSQQLFSSCGSDGSWQAMHDRLDSLIGSSPVTSQQNRSDRVSSYSPKTRGISTTLHEATVTSPSQKKAETPKPGSVLIEDSNDTDGVDVLPPSPEASTSYHKKSQLPDSHVNSCSTDDTVQCRKSLQLAHKIEDDIMADTNSQGVNFSLGTDSSKVTGVDKYDSDSTDIEDDSADKYKLKRLRCIDVFCPDVSSGIPMTRHGVERQESPDKAYMKHSKESHEECQERILNLINQEMKAILEYQIHNIKKKLKWSAPITVDRRLRDTLDRPKLMNKRQQGAEKEGNVEQEQPRRALRLALKEQRDTPTTCDDLMPDLSPAEDGWIDVSTRRRGRRNVRQLGLSRLSTKQPRASVSTPRPGIKNENSNHHKEFSKEGMTADDLDDFEIFPRLSMQRPKETGKHTDKEGKEHVSISNSSVSSSFSNSTNKKSVNEDISMEVMEADQVPKTEVINLEIAEEAAVINSRQLKEKKVTESQTKASGKRAPRKTFMLPSTISNKETSTDLLLVTKSSDIEETSVDATEKSSPPQPSTLSAGIGGEDMGALTPTGTNKWMRTQPVQSSSGKKLKAPNVVSSSEIKEGNEENPGAVNTDDICVLEEDSINGPSLAKYPRREARRGRGGQQEPIRPPPVKLKKPAQRHKDVRIEAATGPSSSQAPELQTKNHNSHGAERMSVKTDEVEEEISCPICQQYFPQKEIEVHASDCTGQDESQPAVRGRDGRGSNRGRRRGCKRKTQNDAEIEEIVDASQASGSGVNEWRIGPKKMDCVICKEAFNEGDDYLIHAQSCQAMKDIQNNIISPDATKTPTPGKVQGGSYRGRQGQVGNKQGYKVKKEPCSSSLFDYLEKGVLDYHPGDITGPEYRQPDTALVQIINCVAVRPHGLSQVLADIYPYCDSYSKRRAIGKFNRAIESERPQPGSIKVCRPTGAIVGPVVVNICGQFYMGKEYQKNIYAKKFAIQLQEQQETNIGNTGSRHYEADNHLLNGLINDTAANRRDWFKDGLKNLVQEVTSGMKVSQIVFPAYIGCGLAGGNWKNDYLPLIMNFALEIRQLGIHVKIVEKKQNSDRYKTTTKTVKSDRQSTINEYAVKYSDRQYETKVYARSKNYSSYKGSC